MGPFNLNMLYLPAEGWTYSTPNRRHCLVVWMVSEIYLCDIDEGWNVRYLSSVGRSKSASDCTIAVPYIFRMATCRRGICCYQWYISVAPTKNLYVLFWWFAIIISNISSLLGSHDSQSSFPVPWRMSDKNLQSSLNSFSVDLQYELCACWLSL